MQSANVIDAPANVVDSGRAVVVAMGVNEDGRRELLGLKVGDSESEPFWAEFNCSAEGKAYAHL